jgi:uncharacterized damage-inducible protein DinB
VAQLHFFGSARNNFKELRFITTDARPLAARPENSNASAANKAIVDAFGSRSGGAGRNDRHGMQGVAMSTREFLESRHKAEYPAFAKVLKALPKERFNYRPHERSPSAAEIVWTLARETKACCDLIDHGRFNWTAEPAPADPQAILSAFEKHYAALDDRINRLSESGWQAKAELLIDGQRYREAPVGEFLWYIFFDAIHHRGQLSTYIRPMGGQVPSIYGPSGDDPGS